VGCLGSGCMNKLSPTGGEGEVMLRLCVRVVSDEWVRLGLIIFDGGTVLNGREKKFEDL
jgi:hypothetical protein